MRLAVAAPRRSTDGMRNQPFERRRYFSGLAHDDGQESAERPQQLRLASHDAQACRYVSAELTRKADDILDIAELLIRERDQVRCTRARTGLANAGLGHGGASVVGVDRVAFTSPRQSLVRK